jgi:hypothetical protein
VKKPAVMGMLASAVMATLIVVGAVLVLAPSVSTGTLQESSLQAKHSTSALVSETPALAVVQPHVTLRSKPKPTHPTSSAAAHKPKKKHHHKPAPPASLDFTISTFNMLGASHTESGGTHARYAPGEARARWAAELLATHGVDVVGFQEFQQPQLSAFLRDTGSQWDVYPGNQLGARGTENSIGWRKDTWELVHAGTVQIPYFDGHERPMPVVRLRNLQTGLEATFANFHNPASVSRFGNQQHWRDVATSKEIALANSIKASTDLPLFVTGDMNERAEYFCRFTAGTGMIAARGGSNENGSCQPDRPRAVDWIFGTRDVHFSGYTEDRSALVQRTTDHPVVFSNVHIGGR